MKGLIHIHVTHTEDSGSFDDPRSRFWRRFSGDPRSLEQRLIEQFPYNLKQYTQSYLAGNDGFTEPFRRASLLRWRQKQLVAGLHYSIRNIRYGSLGFDLEIQGIERLAKLFNFDFDELSIFLESYIPQSFNATFPGTHDFMFNIETSAALERIFQNSEQSTQGSHAAGAQAKHAKTLWVIANFSLLVPVILMVYFITLALDFLAGERASNESRLKSVLAHQEALLKMQADQIHSIQTSHDNINNELIRAALANLRRETAPQLVPTGRDKKAGT